jgi:hypothetical protein
MPLNTFHLVTFTPTPESPRLLPGMNGFLGRSADLAKRASELPKRPRPPGRGASLYAGISIFLGGAVYFFRQL